MSINTRKLYLFVLLAIVALILAACGPAGATNGAETDDTEVAESAPNTENEHQAEDDHADDDHADDDHADDDHADDDHQEDTAGHNDDHDLTTHEPIAGAEEMRIVAKEFEFTPPTIRLHEGEPVNIVFVNEGTLDHEFDLEVFDFHIHALPGETITAGFIPDQSGEFAFACHVPGHFEAGMKGEITIEDTNTN
jgi:uncharacterized cupredoxin-like copper-binding protein